MFEFINRKPENKLELIAQNFIVFGVLFGLIVLGSIGQG